MPGVFRMSREAAWVACAPLLLGCAAAPKAPPTPQFPPTPIYPPDHRYTLDELIELSVHRNASLDVARYEAEAIQGLVDQVKSLFLPFVRYDFAFIGYSNDLSYKAKALNLVEVNVPLTGSYNVENSAGFDELAGDADVLGARGGFSAWVVVRHNDGGG